MASLDFRVGNKSYTVKDLTDSLDITHDAIESLGISGRFYSLTRHKGMDDMFVASIVGDACRVSDEDEWHHTFAVFEDRSSSSADKIAVMYILQYLNNEKYKKAVKKK